MSAGNRRLKCELRFFDKSLIGSYGGIQMWTFLEELKDQKKKKKSKAEAPKRITKEKVFASPMGISWQIKVFHFLHCYCEMSFIQSNYFSRLWLLRAPSWRQSHRSWRDWWVFILLRPTVSPNPVCHRSYSTLDRPGPTQSTPLKLLLGQIKYSWECLFCFVNLDHGF